MSYLTRSLVKKECIVFVWRRKVTENEYNNAKGWQIRHSNLINHKEKHKNLHSHGKLNKKH